MKIKKLVALLTAGVLCLGMSTTAFAAQSVDDASGYVQLEGAEGSVSGVSGDELEGDEKKAYDDAKKVLEDEDAVKAVLEAKGFDTKNVDVVVLGMADYKYYDKDGNEAELPKGATLRFGLNGLEKAKGLKNGDSVYLMHYVNGNWQVITAKVVLANGVLYAETDQLTSLSPIAFLKVMSDGKVVELDKKGEVKTPTTKVSPKTGE